MSFFILLIFIALVILIALVWNGRDAENGILLRLEAIDGRLRDNTRSLDSLFAALARSTAPPTETAPPARAPAAPPPPTIAVETQSSPPEVVSEPAPPPADEPAGMASTPPTPEAEPEPPETQQPVAEEPPSFPPPPPREPTPGENLADFEKRFGTQWVVWVGGLALALGGIFLVRYSIEQGYFGPGARVTFGAVLALALIGVAEWMRRQELRTGMVGMATAHIPSILTAAGTTIAYATVYGAYALYGFVSAPVAFILLGIVALATLAAALVHGPMLAGLGLIGAYVTPLLVSTHQPNYWALYVYLAVVTASAYALARVRTWRWLAITAAVFGIFWMGAGISDPHESAIAAHAFFAVTGFALSAVFIVAGFIHGPPAEVGRIDNVSSGVLAGYLFAAFMLVMSTQHDTIALTALFVLTAATVAIALRSESASFAMPVAAALATLIILHWAVNFDFMYVQTSPSRFALVPLFHIEAVGAHLWFGAATATLFGAAGWFAQGRSRHALVPVMWATAGATAPLAILIATYYRLYHFERSILFAGVALLLAGLYGYAAEILNRRDPRPGLMIGTAVFACSGIAALALALTFALEKGWLTVALALMTPGIALVAEKRPLPVLRWVIAAIVGVLMARIAWDPRIVGAEVVGATPILNWLLYGYGVPAVALWVTGHILRKGGDDKPSRMVDSAAIIFTMLLFTFEIRHLVYNGDVFRAATGLAEVALNVSTALATTIGLERTRLRTGSIVHDWGARIIGALAFAGIVIGLGLDYNPMRTGDPVGGLLFNLILLGYGIPAVLMGVLARIVKTSRPKEVYAVAAVTAIVLALVYLSLEVRTLFHGPVLVIGPTTDAEQYAYSAVWLAFGVALLLAGIALGSQPARLASAAVVTLTAGKVFLYDLAGVQGIFRALSFIGLGLVLMGIGYLYQRLLFPPRAPASVAQDV